MRKYLLILACGLLLVGCTKKVYNSVCPACECEKHNHGHCDKEKHNHPEK